METSTGGLEKEKVLVKRLHEIKQIILSGESTQKVLEKVDALEEALLDHGEKQTANLQAQVSLYPLRQKSLSQALEAAIDAWKNCDVQVFPGTMSTILVGTGRNVWTSLEKSFSSTAAHGDVVMIVTVSNACPKQASAG